VKVSIRWNNLKTEKRCHVASADRCVQAA